MKPTRIIQVIIVALLLLALTGCSAKDEDLSSSIPQESSMEASSQSSIVQESSVEQEPEPVVETMTALYLGENDEGSLRFFIRGEEQVFPNELPSEDLSLLQGKLYLLTTTDGVMTELSPAGGIAPYRAAETDKETYYWTLSLSQEGIQVQEAAAPEGKTFALLAEEEEREDVYLLVPVGEITASYTESVTEGSRKDLLLTALSPIGFPLFNASGEAYAALVLESVFPDLASLPEDTSLLTFLEENSLVTYLTWSQNTETSAASEEASAESEDASADSEQSSADGEESEPDEETIAALQEAKAKELLLSLLPGDLIFFENEVWFSLGQCPDGSLAVLRSPSEEEGGLTFCALGDSEDCLAYRLITALSESIYPDYTAEHPAALLEPALLAEASCVSLTTLSDPEGLASLSARQTAKNLFSQTDWAKEKTDALVPVDLAWFDDALFVGDSISEYLRQYSIYTGELGNAMFLTSVSLSAANALWPISEESVHPTIGGSKVLIEDGVAFYAPKNVYIMLGINSIAFGIEISLTDLEILVDRIYAQSPDVNIIIESVTPMTASSEIISEYLNNYRITEYNARVQALCEEKGWYYVDVASVMQDGYGNLEPSYCADGGGMGIHMSSQGAAVWIDYLIHHVPEDLT